MAAANNQSDMSFSQHLQGSSNIPTAKLPAAEVVDSREVEAEFEVNNILHQLNEAFTRADFEAISDLFVKEGFWRDHLALSWAFRTINYDNIVGFLKGCATSRDGFRLQKLMVDKRTSSRQSNALPMDGDGSLIVIHAFLILETVIGTGEGTMRLALCGGKWRIFTLYTSLRALHGCQEATHLHRPLGVEPRDVDPRSNWLDRRRVESELQDGVDPVVLIIGAGQAGLSVAARLQVQGIKHLLIDQNDHVGDNWRKRYRQLVLHDPVWYDHMPYLKFPPQWPVFTPKDKLADFLEAYAILLELNIWMRTKLVECTWEERSQFWTVRVFRRLEDGTEETRTLRPRHIIQATGHSGQKNEPSFPGFKSFQGDRICHSSEFSGARDNGKGKKAVVIGSCNSGHDIAQDLYDKGFDVTIVQRSSTLVVSSRSITEIGLRGLYDETSPPVEDADLLLQGIPTGILKDMQIKTTTRQRVADKDLLNALEKVGFKLDSGPDGAGLFFKYFQRGGGYYIDVGASSLIASGKIKVKQGYDVTEILPHGVRCADGSTIDADEIVLATGFQDMKSQTKSIFGDAVAQRVDDVWGYNEEGELRTIWQQSGHPGFWLHGGNLALCRYYSQLLALQIQALEKGLYTYGET